MTAEVSDEEFRVEPEKTTPFMTWGSSTREWEVGGHIVYLVNLVASNSFSIFGMYRLGQDFEKNISFKSQPSCTKLNPITTSPTKIDVPPEIRMIGDVREKHASL